MAIAMLAWVVAIPLLGLMTGFRSMTPIAILCLFAYRHHLPVHGTWAFWAERGISTIVFCVLACGEFIGDKLPNTPKRTSAFPLIARVGFGALVGAIAATGLQGPAFEGALLGGIGALAGAFAGFHLRSLLTSSLQLPDFPVALAGDLLAIGASILAMGIITG